MDLLIQAKDLIGNIGAWGWIAVIFIAIFRREWVDKLLSFAMKKNGNGNGHKLEEKLDLIEGNHLAHIQSDLTELKRWQSEENVILSKMLYILEEIKNNTSKK